jgi:hypothetical protein
MLPIKCYVEIFGFCGMNLCLPRFHTGPYEQIVHGQIAKNTAQGPVYPDQTCGRISVQAPRAVLLLGFCQFRQFWVPCRTSAPVGQTHGRADLGPFYGIEIQAPSGQCVDPTVHKLSPTIEKPEYDKPAASAFYFDTVVCRFFPHILFVCFTLELSLVKPGMIV